RMLDPDPAARPALPLTVMNGLLPFAVTRHASVETVLPPPPEVLPEPAGDPAPAPPAGQPRVLIVDDDPGFRQLARKLLDGRGLVCAEAQDAEEAWDASRDTPYDLVLLDVNLPGMGGYELCQKLRARAQPTWQKVIVISGTGDQNQLSEALTRGA